MVANHPSGFFDLAAAPRQPLDATTWPTSPRKTRVRGFRRHASGQTSSRRRCRSMFTPGSRGCAYKTVSGRHEWPNRDPLGDFGNLDSLTPSLDGKSDDDDGISDDELFNTWTKVNLNLFGALGNNPVNLIDAEGHCSLAGGATPEGAEIIAEELGDGAETAAQAGARKEAEEAAAKKAEQQAAKQAAEKASEKVAKAMAKQIERDLGKDARREFHDADHLTDRTLNQLKQDAKDVYDAHGATCPAWMQP